MNKTINRLLMPAFFLLLLGCISTVQGQENKDSLKAAIESKQFVFKVQTVLPVAGVARQVTGEGYDVRVVGDSLVSYLPYFGRAYSVPYGKEGGLKFTSTKFDYILKNRKRGGWDLIIRPKDVSDFREFLFTVSDNGNATLRALSNNRQAIAYNGKVSAYKQL